jgi:two-component system, OmpR family, response regulator VanR
MVEVGEGRPKMRVLVIDDDDIARKLSCSTLKAAGHETFELKSSIGATRCIHEQKVDAVVLDVMLPTVSGDKLARMFRQSSGGEQLGIVLVSSRPKPELRQLAALAQVDDVVTKSEIQRGLVMAVQRAVVRRAGLRRRDG